MNSESPLLAVSLSPSVCFTFSLSASLQKITRPLRTWRDTRQIRPTPTPNVTTCPTWERLPGTHRSTATQSAWRQAMVRVIARRNTAPPLGWIKILKTEDKNSNSLIRKGPQIGPAPWRTVQLRCFCWCQCFGWTDRALGFFYPLFSTQSWQSTFVVVLLACFTITRSQTENWEPLRTTIVISSISRDECLPVPQVSHSVILSKVKKPVLRSDLILGKTCRNSWGLLELLLKRLSVMQAIEAFSFHWDFSRCSSQQSCVG